MRGDQGEGSGKFAPRRSPLRQNPQANEIDPGLAVSVGVNMCRLMIIQIDDDPQPGLAKNRHHALEG